jgi:hypothetical protein
MKKNKGLLKFLIVTITTVGLISGTSIGASASTQLYTFDVISDTHVKPGDTDKTTTALKCIKNNFNDKCIVINGDVVDNMYSYDALSSAVSNANSGSKRLPYIYFNYGNHEFVEDGGGSPVVEWYNWSLNEFGNKTNAIQSSLSYASGVSHGGRGVGQTYDWQYVNSNIFFFLGTDKLAWDDQINCADLNRNYQLSHLDDKLNASGWKFVFCHQPPHGTLHGADWQNCICEREYNDYNGDYFESLVSRHSKTIMFASHLHNNFNSYKFNDNSDSNFHQLGGCSIFGTSSIKEASQGLHVTVYDNQIVVQAVQYNSEYGYSVIPNCTRTIK